MARPVFKKAILDIEGKIMQIQQEEVLERVFGIIENEGGVQGYSQNICKGNDGGLLQVYQIKGMGLVSERYWGRSGHRMGTLKLVLFSESEDVSGLARRIKDCDQRLRLELYQEAETPFGL